MGKIELVKTLMHLFFVIASMSNIAIALESNNRTERYCNYIASNINMIIANLIYNIGGK